MIAVSFSPYAQETIAHSRSISQRGVPSPSRSAAARPASPSARHGLKSALLSRVGDEQMGRFIREQLEREGIDTKGLRTDKDRLTALVLLAVESEGVPPVIFYRSACADMALDENDVEETFIASARAIVVTGTHFSRPNSEAAQLKAKASRSKCSTSLARATPSCPACCAAG